MIIIYQLHFERPISPDHTSQHYTGSSAFECFPRRIASHRRGNGSSPRYLQVAAERGIGFVVSRAWLVWPDDRSFEYRIKARKEGPRLCPLCAERPSPVHVATGTIDELSPRDIQILLNGGSINDCFDLIPF